MPAAYTYKELFPDISDSDMRAYYDFHKRLMNSLGKQPKTFEAYSTRELELIATPNRTECIFMKDGVVIGWLSAEAYESDNGRKCFSYSGDLLEHIENAGFYAQVKTCLSSWKQTFGAQEGFIRVGSAYQKNMCEFLKGELLDEMHWFNLSINLAKTELMQQWKTGADLSGLHEVFSVAVPEIYMEQYVAGMNEGMRQTPTNMLPFTRYTSVEDEKETIIDRQKGGRRHLLLMLLNEREELVGMTNITLYNSTTAPAKQWLTYVIPELRRRGLAKYLKAKMLEHVIADFPEVKVIETDSYIANTPMINLNVEMGYIYTKSTFDHKILIED